MSLSFQNFSKYKIAFIDSFKDIPRKENYLYIGNRSTNYKSISFKEAKLHQEVIIVLPGLNWLENIYKFVNQGFERFAILPSLNLNSSKRVCIVSYEKKMIFLPNYKVMYSSFREYMRENFSEFQDAPQVSHGLNSNVDLNAPKFKEFFKFSIVRNPFDRYASFYRDKLGRDQDHYHYRIWNQPMCSLLGKDKVTLLESLKFVNMIPNSHSDPHFLSQESKLLNGDGTSLVDYVGKIENLDDVLQHIAEQAKIPSIDIPLYNQTKPLKKDFMDFYKSSPESIKLIEKRYQTDFKVFNYNN